MGPVTFGAERDRLLAAGRGGGRRWTGQNGNGHANGNAGDRVQGVWGSGSDVKPVPVEPETPVAVAVAEPEVAPIGTGFLEPAEETPAPADAIPIQSAPEAGVATVAVSIEGDVPTDRLLGAIESVKGALVGRPGPLPVVLSLSVAGATRTVRLPDRVAWDDRLADAIRRAAGVPVGVELRAGVEEVPSA